MDPRIAWYPTELEGNAFNIWSNVWMVSQMNCTNPTLLTTPNVISNNQRPNIISTSSLNDDNEIRSTNLESLNNTNSQYNSLGNLNDASNFGMSVTSQMILNGLKSRKINKACTFGFNFPINQHVLDDPMSTPWLELSTLELMLGDRDTSARSRTKTASASSTASTSSLSTSSASPCHEDSLSSSSTVYDYDEESIESKQFANSEGLQTLHKEIQLFAKYIESTEEENFMRDEIIRKLTQVIKNELPTADVDVFGSYRTGLFLPTSDIDMVVREDSIDKNNLPLKVLKDVLIKEKISDQENIKVLDRASVPIIKILETKTDLKVDISFNKVNGLKSVELIKSYLDEFPCLKPLVMVLKQFLIQRDFNEVWTGGIGSYSLIMMVVSFLQLHPRIDCRSPDVNYGVLLIEFFELYGRSFNYTKTAIRVHDGGCYLPKEEILSQFKNFNRYTNPSILCIEDPLDFTNDIGKGSYGALRVKQAFEYAYINLSQAVFPQNEFLIKNANKQSLLGRIIRITKEVRDYRQWVKLTYEKQVSAIKHHVRMQARINEQNKENEMNYEAKRMAHMYPEFIETRHYLHQTQSAPIPFPHLPPHPQYLNQQQQNSYNNSVHQTLNNINQQIQHQNRKKVTNVRIFDEPNLAMSNGFNKNNIKKQKYPENPKNPRENIKLPKMPSLNGQIKNNKINNMYPKQPRFYNQQIAQHNQHQPQNKPVVFYIDEEINGSPSSAQDDSDTKRFMTNSNNDDWSQIRELEKIIKTKQDIDNDSKHKELNQFLNEIKNSSNSGGLSVPMQTFVHELLSPIGNAPSLSSLFVSVKSPNSNVQPPTSNVNRFNLVNT